MAKKQAERKQARRKARLVVSLSLSSETIEFLDQIDDSRSQYIEKMIHKSKAYRDWKKSQGGS